MRVGLCSILALFAVAPAAGAPTKMEIREVRYDVRSVDLPSGMRVLVERDPTRPLVAVVTSRRAEAVPEPFLREAAGIAHGIAAQVEPRVGGAEAEFLQTVGGERRQLLVGDEGVCHRLAYFACAFMRSIVAFSAAKVSRA